MSDLQRTLEFQLKAAGIEGWVREHRFHPARRWRFDLFFEKERVAVEVDGGIY